MAETKANKRKKRNEKTKKIEKKAQNATKSGPNNAQNAQNNIDNTLFHISSDPLSGKTGGDHTSAAGDSAGKKYQKTSEHKEKVRKRYEAGEFMIDIARDMNLNYNTLLSLASKEGWKRGSTKEWIYTEEILRIINENVDRRSSIIDEYKEMMGRVKKILQTHELIYIEQSTAIAQAAKAIETLYKIDKEINHIHSDIEEIDYRKRMIELEKWKRQIEDQMDTDEKIVVE